MADGRTILQEYDEKVRSRIQEFEEQQKLLAEIINVFRDSVNNVKEQKGDSSNG